YCARGDMENRIKECQTDTFAGGASAATMRAYQLRLRWANSISTRLAARGVLARAVNHVLTELGQCSVQPFPSKRWAARVRSCQATCVLLINDAGRSCGPKSALDEVL